ncbi:rho guanine nucleotide exchange factor 12 isoform X2 [Bombina bombina]|uniref:rho guanine nucleotide exchange factor 12 isoform X2 n=1 Tax=Bombina bombina TaxID=8345 RepID=UPI00235AAC52|nr:rho guanine nucleotide exchange factor 12 isoform X2 [Bombina bombina]
MSGTQSAASDRHGSILNRDSSTDKKQKVERSVSSSHDFDPTGLVQRCVIIQRDENGFGLTVSGDNPVFVQSVKEDGAAMRAGVQTGDRIIKVNGTHVTHSNHLEVVKLIKSGSYVALTVQGRPPGSPHIPLSDSEIDPFSVGHIMPPQSPGTPGLLERITSPVLMGEENNVVHSQKLDILKKMLQQEQEQLQSSQEEYNNSPSSKLFKDIKDTRKHIGQLQEQLCKAKGPSQTCSDPLQISELDIDLGELMGRTGYSSGDGSRPNSDIADSPRSGQREKSFLEESPEKSELQDTDSQSSMGSPSTRIGQTIIGAEDDDFGTESEQMNGQCSCFQNMDLLKTHPAHLAVFIHHVVSQFEPAGLLCYLYADLYHQTNSKETRRIFQEFNQFFLDRSANLRISVPEDIALDLEKRRLELIPEELHRQYVQTVQEKLCPEVQRHLEDFRQKRSMGLTLAESELAKLDAERFRERNTLEKEKVCAESILQKIDEVLLSSLPHEEEKSSTVQYVILTYMKHLGVKVKEPRCLEHKRGRIGFLPKIKQSMKKEKEGEEKGKRRGFPSILGPQRRPSRQDSNAIGRAMEIQRQKHPKHLSTSSSSSPEPADGSRLRTSGGSVEGPDPSHSIHSPVCVGGFSSPDGGKDQEPAVKLAGEGSSSVESCDGNPRTPGTVFDFPSPPLDLLQEEVGETDRFNEQDTPKASRKLDSLVLGDTHSEDELYDPDLEMDPPNWQELVSREILKDLKPHEIKQQEVIHELFYTERAHVRTLNVLDQVFHQRLMRETILTLPEIRSVFSNLEEILQLHVGLNEHMKAARKRYETSVIDRIGDDVLSWFSGAEEEKLKQAVATFCSNQPFALEMIKSRQKKDPKFLIFVQDAESNPLCRRLQLKDIIPTEMQRLTKYPLLLDNIAKYSDRPDEKEKVKTAAKHCRRILKYVNQAVREAENKQRLEDYQRRLDLSYLKPGEYPMIDELRSLDLTKRKMCHEGPLVWKVNRDKTIELYTLLLDDILVLLQKQDDKLILRCHSKLLASSTEIKHIFSPVIKLNTVLVRQVATDNKALFVISMSENGAQIYELIANTVSERNVWQDLITRMAEKWKVEDHKAVIPLPQAHPGILSEEEHEDVDEHKVVHEQQEGNATSTGKDSDIEGTAQELSSPSLMHRDALQPPLQSSITKDQHSSHTVHRTSPISSQASLEQHPPDLSQSSSPITSQSSEHYRAMNALKNLDLLKQLIIKQLMLLQKEEADNYKLFCSRKRCDQEGEKDHLYIQRRGTRETRSRRDLAAEHRKTGRVSEHSVTDLDQQGMASEESGEQFFDAPELQNKEHLEGQNKGSDAEEMQFRISGKYLFLDGYENIQESSTDEDLSISHLTSQYSFPEHTASSPQVAERLGPPICEASIPGISSEAFSQMLHYIGNIEADLQELKGCEVRYHALLHRLSTSGLSEGDPDIAMTDKG